MSKETVIPKLELSNYDGSSINMPDFVSFCMLIDHCKQNYPELYERHFGDFNIHARALADELTPEEQTEWQDKYVEFLGNLKAAFIMPDGSELLNPLKKVLPVGCTQPKTLEQMINSSLNIGKIYDDYERLEEERYNAEKEYAAFEEISSLAEKNPERFKSLFEDSQYSDAIKAALQGAVPDPAPEKIEGLVDPEPNKLSDETLQKE